MKKSKCTICLKVKGKRLCKLKNKSLVCPRCCAEIRDYKCNGCSHYAQAEKYSLEKKKKSNFKEFTAIIDPEIDNAVDEALSFVERGDIKKGEKIITGLIEKNPGLYIVQYGMGTVLAMKGNYTESIIHFDKCLEIFPYFVEAWFNRGNSYKNLFNVGEAIKSFRKVVELGDVKDDFVKAAKELLDYMAENISKDTGLSLDQYVKSMDIFNNAFSIMQNRQYEKAIIEFKKVLTLNKTNAQTYGNLGLCYAFLGHKETALSYFDKAIKIDPKYEPAITNKSFVLALKDGEKLPDVQTETIEYYKDVAVQMKGLSLE